MNHNLGWLFNKESYWGVESISSFDDSLKDNLKEATPQLIEYPVEKKKWAPQSIHLKTTYPGTLFGTGYHHETGMDGEFKIGFHFDYTTGMPCLPGSSVKGILRSVFPNAQNKNIRHKEEKYLYLIKKLKDIGIAEVTHENINALEREIFCGEHWCENKNRYEPIPIAHRDIFFDAFPVKSKIGSGRFLGDDFITPHSSPFKDPVPLMFLKILPQVVFEFRFDLKDSTVFPDLIPDKKVKLFEAILRDTGIGAKTNVGYGRLVGVDEENHKESAYRSQTGQAYQTSTEEEEPEIIPKHSKIDCEVTIEIKKLLKKEMIIPCIVSEVNEDYVQFIPIDKKYKILDLKKKQEYMKNKRSELKLKKGDRINITIQQEPELKQNLNFSPANKKL